ncbi:nitrate reductase molybdenum cofactor assembly chaperone [Chromobacterium sinusclupearum]|uniref:Nitrate reductase molybdenum cofactor assembly chaperone n=1 Tax=Chromobacterium sinusclupearum TaxID=2077146 RepID=A0A2K4MKT6_9NEIS|nr:nitrate reductase molybdenum cofactor assembly chaperone [Chromobacterium sinusclupearum]POA97701.1 nitrate reductase molybdenum cofactor assembly chaperone [Chromobacterium sinusclupearum]
MNAFRLISALLLYPTSELVEALPLARQLSQALPGETAGQLAPLLTHLQSHDLLALQSRYVDWFDRQRPFSLHLFEHVYGESRERGEAMVSLMQTYHDHGFFIAADELPDYLPLFLEFLSQMPAESAAGLLGEAVHVIAAVGRRLADAGNPYAGAFAALTSLSPVAPLPVSAPPVRDMDEAMEVFGSGFDGMEPLLTPSAAPQPVHFYPRPAPQGV